jgi:hypothetical protein
LTRKSPGTNNYDFLAHLPFSFLLNRSLMFELPLIVLFHGQQYIMWH